MTVAYTITDVDPNGPIQSRSGTFTSAAGDGNGETITISTHGLAYVTKADVSLAVGGINTPVPKVTVSGSTVTWTVDDTQGLSGTFHLRGRG